jgi:hypothetical protein
VYQSPVSVGEASDIRTRTSATGIDISRMGLGGDPRQDRHALVLGPALHRQLSALNSIVGQGQSSSALARPVRSGVIGNI